MAKSLIVAKQQWRAADLAQEYIQIAVTIDVRER
jgi:hypothetical protein